MESKILAPDHTREEIRVRLTLSVLRRTWVLCSTNMMAIVSYLFILSEKKAGSSLSSLFCYLFLALNIQRVWVGTKAKGKPTVRTIRRLEYTFSLVTYALSVLWLFALGVQCATFGLDHPTSTFALLITTGFTAGSLALFSPIRNLGLINVSILGGGSTLILLIYAKDPSSYILVTLSATLTLVMLKYTNEYYKALYHGELQVIAKLHENESIKGLLNSVPGVMIVLDQHLLLVNANEDFLKRTNKDIVGNHVDHLGFNHEFRKTLESFSNSHEDRMMFECNLGPLFQDEFYLVSMTKLHLPEERIAILAMNIETQRRMQQQLGESRRKSEHIGRLIALGEMVSSVAHEIRNPLSIITGRASYLKMCVEKDALTPAMVVQESDQITNMVDRIGKIIQTVLRFSRGDIDTEMKKCSARSIVEEALLLTESRLKTERFEVRVKYDDSDPDLNCNQLHIGQVFVNLISNSIDALENSETRWISITVEAKDPMVRFVFTDSGVGIPPEVREKLMTPFFTTKESGKGTGLGLSISNSIIINHLGSLEVDTKAVNTTFVIELPLFSADAQAPTAA